MKIIRGLSGFGDGIYLRVAVEWLLKNRPDNYVILNNFPTIFSDLPVTVQKFNRSTKVDYDFSYLSGKKNPDTTQFDDMVTNANLNPIEFTSNLKNRQDSSLILSIPLYPPFGQHAGGSNSVLAPEESSFNKIIKQYKNIKSLYRKKYEFSELVNLFNKTKLVICQVGWAVPMAEMLDTPLLVCFNSKSFTTGTNFVRTITPQKVLAKKNKNSRFISI